MSGRPSILEQARQRILILDGAMGTYLRELGLTDEDYGRHSGCNEFLSISKPGLVSRVHEDYLSAGADIIETNSFGGAPHILAEHGLAEKAADLNRAAAALARQAADKYSSHSHPRFVAGSIGPGSKIPSLGHISFDELKASYAAQSQALLAGGVDCFLVETCQDLLQAKAAVSAILDMPSREGRPILVQFTIDQSGRTLTGSDISALLASMEAWEIDGIGLNCSLGPEGLAEAVYYLGHNSSKLLSLLPNAGLPKMKNGHLYYDLKPEQFSASMEDFASNPGLNFAGGCCGTGPEHIKLLAHKLKNIRPRHPAARIARVSSLYQSQDISVSPKPLLIGERSNASGSKAFRDLLEKNDFHGLADMAGSQEKEGAHAIDLSLARPGRDQAADYRQLCRLLNTKSRLPFMIDSTDPEAIEAALKELPGRSIINSINLEDGGQKAQMILPLCRKYGAALVCLTIDEEGLARTAKRKVEIAGRLAALAAAQGLAPQDIFFDTLTFTLGSGDRSLNRAGLESLKAIARLKKLFPASFTILGVSNISYGLPSEARRALNSVFLHRAVEAGLDAAIIHPGKIIPLNQIPSRIVRICNDLIFDHRLRNPAPLEALLEYYSSSKPERKMSRPRRRALPPGELLHQRILRGEVLGVAEAIAILLKEQDAGTIIDRILLPAMDRVGILFGRGEMQLPFVLRSAEVMQMAVELLKPHLKGQRASSSGTIIIATVRGDIHDIGKNLAGLILEANGFRVVDLGVRQSAEDIMLAIRKHRPMAVGLSGLLVESVRAMSEYLVLFEKSGISLPVICGGAALNRSFVAKELQPKYSGPVFYARDAMEGLGIVQSLAAKPPAANNSAHSFRPMKTSPEVFRKVPLDQLLKLLDRKALFERRWLMVSPGATGAKKRQQVGESQKCLDLLWKRCLKEGLFEPLSVAAIFVANWDGRHLRLKSPDGRLVKLELSGNLAGRYFRSGNGSPFNIGLQAVTLGGRIGKESARLKRHNRIHDQFMLYGLSAELTEALAKWTELQIRKHLSDGRTRRISPGYPVWPSLMEQRKLFLLLKPERIGIRLTRSCQMVPEFSTSAMVIK